MESVDKFLRRAAASTKAKSKEIRLTIAEAQELGLEVGQLLDRENKLLAKIVQLQEGKTGKPITISDLRDAFAEASGSVPALTGEITMDGGSFKS